ncbi:MAG: hypothetical protein Kow0069_31410 [Promethearchaeota archaeon]
MLKLLLICNEAGIPFFSRKFAGDLDVDPLLFSGLISAIENIGHALFKQKIATITYGEQSSFLSESTLNQIVVITKEMFSTGKCVNFVFVCSGNYEVRGFREIATTLFVAIKPMFQLEVPDGVAIRKRVNAIIENQLGGLRKYVA